MRVIIPPVSTLRKQVVEKPVNTIWLVNPESGGHRRPAPSLVIISGGQTGVDRAALDVARELGIPHGGWCPRGRLAEDGVIPPGYDLRETESSLYRFRTERNVCDGDATLILYRQLLVGGTHFTDRMARKHGKPCLRVDLAGLLPIDCEEAANWIGVRAVRVLNVAGPRESTAPGIYEQARVYLRALLPMLVPAARR